MTVGRAIHDWLAVQPHQRQGLRALQVCLGLMLLFRASTEARFAAYLWGPRGIGQGSSAMFLHPWLAKWADAIYGLDLGPKAVVVVLGLAATCLVFGYRTRLAAGAALLSFWMLEARLSELGDGGDNAARLTLTYMLLVLSSGKTAERGSLAVWLHNVGVLAIGLQIGVIYLTSGFMKITGEKWNNGTAMYVISQVEWFSHPALRGMFVDPFVTTLTSYATMLFQFWFPIAVLTRFRLIWVAIGIAFHLGIAVFMGLICFSLAMIGLELFLITDAEYTRLAAWIRLVAARLQHAALRIAPRARFSSGPR
jgi:hypothetical protein